MRIDKSIILSIFLSRSLIYPWLIKGGKPTPVFLSFLAFMFCVLNGYMQARYLTKFARYEMSYVSSPRFVCGVAIFFMGMAINIHSDHVLRNLRRPGETGYNIPRGIIWKAELYTHFDWFILMIYWTDA